MVGGKDVAALRRYINEANNLNVCQQPDKYGNNKGYAVSQQGLLFQALIVALNTKNIKLAGHYSTSICSNNQENGSLQADQTRKYELRV
jgi:hypothetical protein